MSYKKRILFISEASFLNTGFSTYNRELLPRLAATNKFDIAELGTYANIHDPRIESFIKGRWKFYPGMPSTPDEQKEFEVHNTDPAQPGQQLSQFGKWCFDKVVADFKPDIVCVNTDAWMASYISRSPLRRYFQWIWMVIPDSIPQREEWIDTYVTCDYIAAYSDFGINAMRKSSPHLEVRFNPPDVDLLGLEGLKTGRIDNIQFRHPGKLHPIPLRPGVDLEVFKPLDKGVIRQKWGLNPDNPIILIVQRNQARKRLPEAIQAFALMKERYKGHAAIDKSIMVLHTSWPDNIHSADYPRCIERTHKNYHGMPYQHKNIYAEILNTFLCNNPQCGHVFLAHAIHLRRVGPHTQWCIQCPQCQQISARPPNTSIGYTREQMAEIYNIGDILLQMSIAEGEGMPPNEAKACGTMLLATDYASLSEKVKVPDYEHINKNNYTMHLGGDSLKVSYLYEEPETNQFRAHTSIEDTADKLAKYLMNSVLLRKMQYEARKSVELNYNADNTAKQWEFILDKKAIHNRDETWNKPVSLIKIDMNEPNANLTDSDFVDWCYISLLGYRPEAVDKKGKEDWLKTLEIYRQQGKSAHEARKMVTNYFRTEATNLNNVEHLRVGKTLDINKTNPDTVSALVVI